MYRHFHILLMLLVWVGCEKREIVDPKTQKPTVVATTTMLGDLTRQIGGDEITVVAIMGPGGDPHLYQPTPRDAKTIAQSDLVVTSGLHLEGWIDDLVRNAGGEHAICVASNGIDPIRMENSPGGVDPHFWFDLALWQIAAKNVATELKQLLPAAKHPTIEQNLQSYISQSKRVDEWLRAQLQSVPKAQRVLVTSHDAFAYFGRAYDIEVVAIQGVSTEQEASDRDVVNVIETVRSKNVTAVFIESSVNPALINQVAKETGVKTAGPLFSDSIGAANTPASTFLGTVRENTRMITEGLGGAYVAFGLDTNERTQ